MSLYFSVDIEQSFRVNPTNVDLNNSTRIFLFSVYCGGYSFEMASAMARIPSQVSSTVGLICKQNCEIFFQVLTTSNFRLGMSSYRKLTDKSVKLFYRFMGKIESVNSVICFFPEIVNPQTFFKCLKY